QQVATVTHPMTMPARAASSIARSLTSVESFRIALWAAVFADRAGRQKTLRPQSTLTAAPLENSDYTRSQPVVVVAPNEISTRFESDRCRRIRLLGGRVMRAVEILA